MGYSELVWQTAAVLAVWAEVLAPLCIQQQCLLDSLCIAAKQSVDLASLAGRLQINSVSLAQARFAYVEDH